MTTVLTPLYVITPEPPRPAAPFLMALAATLASGIQLVQLRAKTYSDAEYVALAHSVSAVCAHYAAQLMINRPLATLLTDAGTAIECAGWHLTSTDLHCLLQRPIAPALLGVSAHTAADLQQAERIGADYALLSPIKPTQTHPTATPLGWAQFTALAATVTLPVYALGGLQRTDCIRAQQYGAHGIAAIRGLWVS